MKILVATLMTILAISTNSFAAGQNQSKGSFVVCTRGVNADGEKYVSFNLFRAQEVKQGTAPDFIQVISTHAIANYRHIVNQRIGGSLYSSYVDLCERLEAFTN